jgi:hypothetical protein
MLQDAGPLICKRIIFVKHIREILAKRCSCISDRAHI